jgi:Ser/Thr protein kinase RdoA (MazF antagonist)
MSARQPIVNQVAAIIRRYPADCQPTQVDSLDSAGGLSGARFWQIVAPRGVLVLRRWPTEHPTPERLQFIHAVLKHAAAHGMEILPVPIATTTGATFIRHDGHLWELAPWLPGTANYEGSPSVEKLRAAMRALAEFHISVADFPTGLPLASSQGPAPAITHRLARLHELASGGMESLARAVTDATWPELAPLARRFAAELPRVVPLAISRLAPCADVPLPLQPCIRDVWHDHVLFDGDTVTGLIDFGAVQIDTPATDVARLLGSLVGDDAGGWREGLTAYSAVRPLSDRELNAVPALDVAGTVLAGCNWIRWVYSAGRQFDNPAQIAARLTRALWRTEAIR